MEPDSPEHSAALAQRLIKTLEQRYETSNIILQISASIGIAIYPSHGKTEHELMANADAALSLCKRLLVNELIASKGVKPSDL